jgi:hypothetical protein
MSDGCWVVKDTCIQQHFEPSDDMAGQSHGHQHSELKDKKEAVYEDAMMGTDARYYFPDALRGASCCILEAGQGGIQWLHM